MDSNSNLEEIRDAAIEFYEDEKEVAAIEMCRVLAERDPDDTYVRFVLGDSLRIVGRMRECIEVLENLRKKEPQRAKLFTVLADAYTATGDLDRAGCCLEEASRIGSPELNESGWFWNICGANYAARQRYEDAIRCYRKAVALDGPFDEAYLNLGLTLRKAERYDEATQAFKSAKEHGADQSKIRELLKSMEGLSIAKSMIAKLR